MLKLSGEWAGPVLSSSNYPLIPVLFYSPKTSRDEVSSDHLRSSPTKLKVESPTWFSDIKASLPFGPQNASSSQPLTTNHTKQIIVLSLLYEQTNIHITTKSKINAIRMPRFKLNYLLVSYLTHENCWYSVRHHLSCRLLQSAVVMMLVRHVKQIDWNKPLRTQSQSTNQRNTHDIIMQAMIHQSQLLWSLRLFYIFPFPLPTRSHEPSANVAPPLHSKHLWLLCSHILRPLILLSIPPLDRLYRCNLQCHSTRRVDSLVHRLAPYTTIIPQSPESLLIKLPATKLSSTTAGTIGSNPYSTDPTISLLMLLSQDWAEARWTAVWTMVVKSSRLMRLSGRTAAELVLPLIRSLALPRLASPPRKASSTNYCCIILTVRR